ncbi:general secretion pathway protein D [Synechococcus sp. CCY 9618]|uniref:type II secretion system protein GspD n=1 Tax=Synechococcus sp. CCY 9618 TaxID=2815602 RepID=UPI001C213004
MALQQGTGLSALAATVVPPPSGSSPSRADRDVSQASGSLQIKLRRLPDSVEVVIEGTGPAPVLQQTTQGATWMGRLQTATPMALRAGPQRLSLPEAGLQSVTFEGSGTLFELKVSPTPGFPVGRPVVSGDGRSLILTFNAPALSTLQTLTPNATTPGRVPQPGFIPPLQPRAVAPPLGDMAVGTMTISNPSSVNVSGPPVTMTLRNAPAKDVLMALSQLGGYGFVYVDDANDLGRRESLSPSAEPPKPGSPATRPISISFRREAYGRALNSALLAAGLQGKKDGNTIFAGPNVLAKNFGAQLSKVYRLNQVPPNSAADYLANLGAQVSKTNTITTAVSEGVASTSAPAGSPTSATTTSSSTTLVETFGASEGPLIGLRATTDTRLSTITLVGSPSLVAIAEQYLKQLDLRQRQVALSVKILDVNLENDFQVANSFAFRWGNNFIVNDNGSLAANFGSLLGGSSPNLGTQQLPAVVPFQGFNGTPNPGVANNYPKDSFFDFVQAQILSRNTKLLASPTIIMQENPSVLREGGGQSSSGGGDTENPGGLDEYTIDSPIGRRRANEAVVRVGTNVITQFDVNSSGGSGATANIITCEPTLSTAGLVLGARVEKIDDNGFVTFTLSPSVSAVTDRQSVPGCGFIDTLSVRRLDSGALRVRDGQTLILTGVISDFDRSVVTKWPILGDIPLIGQFFRGTSNSREKRELVIMVTPRIINDTEGGTYGYGYQPSTPDSRAFLRGAPQPPLNP